MASKSSKEHPALAAVRASGTVKVKVKVAGSDIARDWFGDTFVDHFSATATLN